MAGLTTSAKATVLRSFSEGGRSALHQALHTRGARSLQGLYLEVGYCRSFRGGRMSKDALSSRHRGHEERHFQRIERELIEKLRRHAEENAKRRTLSEETGVDDPTILNELLALGYTRETLALLHLVPLVHVAWADGHVSDREQELIENIALARGIAKDSS